MPTQITVNFLGGLPPFNIYTCDTGYTTCIYVDTIGFGQLPYSFDLPFVLEGMSSVGVKVVDSNDCVASDNLIIEYGV